MKIVCSLTRGWRRPAIVSTLAALAASAGCHGSSTGDTPPPAGEAQPTFEARSIDGTGNSPIIPDAGSTDVALLRLTSSDYADGDAAPAGAARPSARAISNAVHAQTASVPNAAGASDLFWSWGQFIDHDIDLTESAVPAEPFPIPVPTGDPQFDPMGTGTATIPLNRSAFVGGSSPRQQINQITAFLDGSMVYGSDAVRAAALRANDGTGRLLVDSSDPMLGDRLPRNTAGLPNAPTGADPTLFLAGDVRANENVLLTAMHTLWVREHNRIADAYRARFPDATGDQVYELARRWVGAEIQAITYEEWLPLLLGPGGIAAYPGYDATLEPGIFNEFSTACFRFGHSLLSSQLLRLDAGGASIPAGPLALRDAFFSPDRLDESGLEPLLRGAASQRCEELDALVVDEVRNFLFGPPGSGGLDLPSLNIQRGRDHGLPSYNDARRGLGLVARSDFDEITADATVEAGLRSVYASVEDVDMWSGALAEDDVPGAMTGELLSTVLARQFELLRDGDRFYYERRFTPAEVAELRATRLADVIRRNTLIDIELQDDVFVVPVP